MNIPDSKMYWISLFIFVLGLSLLMIYGYDNEKEAVLKSLTSEYVEGKVIAKWDAGEKYHAMIISQEVQVWYLGDGLDVKIGDKVIAVNHGKRTGQRMFANKVYVLE